MTRLELTSEEWGRVHAMAQELARDVDRNEYAKVVTYMRRTGDPARFLKLLRRLPQSPFIRTNRTRDYFKGIAAACGRHLDGLEQDRAVLVAAWSFRLMTYYQPSSRQQGRRRPGGRR